MGLFRKLQNKPTLFLSITGMRLERFESLMPEFEQVYDEMEAQSKSCVVKTGEERQRQVGGGAQFSTALQERLLRTALWRLGAFSSNGKIELAGERHFGFNTGTESESPSQWHASCCSPF